MSARIASVPTGCDGERKTVDEPLFVVYRVSAESSSMKRKGQERKKNESKSSLTAQCRVAVTSQSRRTRSNQFARPWSLTRPSHPRPSNPTSPRRQLFLCPSSSRAIHDAKQGTLPGWLRQLGPPWPVVAPSGAQVAFSGVALHRARDATIGNKKAGRAAVRGKFLLLPHAWEREPEALDG